MDRGVWTLLQSMGSQRVGHYFATKWRPTTGILRSSRISYPLEPGVWFTSLGRVTDGGHTITTSRFHSGSSSTTLSPGQWLIALQRTLKASIKEISQISLAVNLKDEFPHHILRVWVLKLSQWGCPSPGAMNFLLG